MSSAGFLDLPETTANVQSLYDDDIGEVGYVVNASRLWADRRRDVGNSHLTAVARPRLPKVVT